MDRPPSALISGSSGPLPSVAMIRFCLSAYHNAGLSVRRAKLISANALRAGRDYQFHPDGIRTLEIRSLGRLAQGVDAVLLLPGVRVGETRQLEHDPRVFGHFTQTDSNFRSFGLHTDLGTGAHSALIGRDLEILATAAQGDWLRRGSASAAGTTSSRARARPRAARGSRL